MTTDALKTSGITIPDLALVVLIGPSGARKSQLEMHRLAATRHAGE